MIIDLLSINSLSLHATEQLVQQKRSFVPLPLWMSHVINAVIHPVHVEISHTSKSDTDATSNCKMKENFSTGFSRGK